jgi:uncharacterized phiE125 gp8 family phage protein
MKVALVTAPAEEPVKIEDAKQHLRVDIEDDDNLILSMTAAAREHAENVTHRKLITQTWRYYLDEWPTDKSYIELPFPPLQSVTSVKYTDSDLTVHTWSTAEWETDIYEEPGRVVLSYGETWPTDTLNVASPIVVEFVCGYGTPDDVPEGIKLGIKVDLADLYEQREAWVQGVYEHLPTIDRLYAPYRNFRF